MAVLTVRRWPRTGAVLSAVSLSVVAACSGTSSSPAVPAGQADVAALAALPWDSVVARARGSTVVWRMWRGDPGVTAYVDGWVAPQLAARFGITLRAVSGQGAELVNQLVTEREAGRQRGTASLLWINGETFDGLRREGLLAGPWSGRLPNAALVDSASPIVLRDFEQPTDGFESPWGRVQFALIHDTRRTPDPPRTVEALGAWILAHPGRFTHDESFTGVTFLKTVLYAQAGGVARLQGGFREDTWTDAEASLFGWVERHRPAFWREGRAFPRDVAALHRLFTDGEVDFTMSNNEHEVVAKIRQGVLPPTSRAFVLRDGTIANTHYLGIPFNAPNTAGAMVVADFLLSPEAQFEKRRPEVWADGTVLGRDRLPDEWRVRFDSLEAAGQALPHDTLQRYARPEVAPEYHVRVQAAWRRRVRGAG